MSMFSPSTTLFRSDAEEIRAALSLIHCRRLAQKKLAIGLLEQVVGHVGASAGMLQIAPQRAGSRFIEPPEAFLARCCLLAPRCDPGRNHARIFHSRHPPSSLRRRT